MRVRSIYKGVEIMQQNEVILRAAAEGGGITLYGVRTDGGWLFSREVIDQTSTLLDEPGIEHRTNVVTTWEEALSLLDRYQWQRFAAIEVHPEFRDLVFEAVLLRSGDGRGLSEWCMERWEEYCLRG
jgi:hypothetical protein